MNNEYSAILVLGIRLLKGDVPPKEMKKRIRYARKIAGKMENLPVILSGGITEGRMRSEASVMKEMLLEEGISESRIIPEERSLNTSQNLRYSKPLIPSLGKVLIVTSDYHRLRTMLTAHRMGVPVYVYGIKTGKKGKLKKILMELFFCIDLLMGWQDEGGARPVFLTKLFNLIFHEHKK